MRRKAPDQQADRDDHGHQRRFGNDSGEVAHQQVGYRAERSRNVRFVFFREHDDDHVVKQTAFLQEKESNERDREGRDDRVADRIDDRCEQVVDQVDVQQRLDLLGDGLDDRKFVVPDGERLFDEVFERHQRLVEIADELRDVER